MRIWAACAVVAVFAGACTARSGSSASGATPSSPGTQQATCIDRDTDGFGASCAPGPDCDDTDPKVHDGCLHCAQASEGCACKPGTKPTACFLEKTRDENGEVMCHEGTRYCRDGKWSGCESVFSFAQPKASSTTSLIDTTAMLTQCNDCNVACFRVTDSLDPVDGGLQSASDGGVSWANGGGLTLEQLDGGSSNGSGGNPTSIVSWNPPACSIGSGVGNDYDCDGIPDDLDPYPNTSPFATANPAIFLQIGPGDTGTGQLDLKFFLNSADVYFLMDQTGSMAEERDALKAALTTGDYINDPSFDCADYDFDHVPNNELKMKGILGAIRCKIRDAYFGTGFFREIPFGGYGNSDQTVYWNYSDITGDVDAVLAAINRFENIGNNDWPEADTVALYNVLTGNGLYLGTQLRGVPPRTTACSGSDWGYPCFRAKAVPIIVMFTDAPYHNGPTNNTLPYGSTSYGITAGTGDKYYPVPSTNETFNGSAVLGDVTSSYKTVTGDTTDMRADLTAAMIGTSCIGSDDGKDAVFQFNLSQQKAVTIESTGSQFDTVLALYTGVPGSPTDLPASDNMNASGAAATDMGSVEGGYMRVAGDTSAMTSNYGWSEVGCDAATDSPSAVYKFTTTAASTQVAVDTSGSSFDTVVALYSALPPTPPAVTPIANTNDDSSTAYNAGEIYNGSKAFSGDTSALNADYSLAQVGCNAVNAANDAVYAFTLSNATRVRLSTEGSAFDTVLSLYDNLANPIGAASVGSTNENQYTAYNVGDLDGKIFQLTGSTNGMNFDYSGTQIGCNATNSSPDAMFKFHLNAPTDVQIDTIGSTWDTVLGLFNNPTLDPSTYLTSDNQNEAYGTGYDLGTVNGKDFRITGNTSNMLSDYAKVPDDACTAADSATDAVYKFHLDTSTQMRFDTTGTGWDTTASLHRVSPTEPSTDAGSNINDVQSSVIDLGDLLNTSFQRTGDTSSSSFHHDYTVACGNTTGKDVVYKFTLSQSTIVQIDTLGTAWDTVLGLYSDANPLVTVTPSAPSAIPVTGNYSVVKAKDAGAIDGAWLRYSGTTNCTTGTWMENNQGNGNGCKSDDNSPAVFYNFSVTGASKSITVETNNATDFDAVIYLYQYTNAAKTTWSFVNCDRVVSGLESVTATLTTGNYFVVVKGKTAADKGNYVLSIKDNSVKSNEVACNDDISGNVLQSTIVATLSAGTYWVIMSGRLATNQGQYAIRFRDKVWWNGEIACNDNISGTNLASRLDYSVTPGDYWVVVKGKTATSKGAYSLHVGDLTNPPTGPTSIVCDDNGVGGTSTQSKIVRTALPAGDYWVALKGKSSTGNAYKVNIADLSAAGSGARLQCDDDGGDAPRSMIQRDLQAGSYQVIVKGKSAADAGAYKLFMRDVTNQPISRLNCSNDGGAGNASYFESPLPAGTYYAVVKGNNATDKGAYSFSVRDVTSRPLSGTACDDNGSTYSTSKITATLDAGTYYVALKGKDATQSGPYQLSLGGGTTHAGTWAPPTWSSTLTALQNSQARVITILSCFDDSSHGNTQGDCNTARDQATSIANTSDALGANLSPLVFDISKNGSGLSTAVVDAVSELAKYLEMNVTARVVFEPDSNPGFNVTVHAIDQAGDGCSGMVGVTHQHCIPGASPRFTIDFENPLATPVQLNPNDPQGGYNFRAELIADGQFVVEQVPIYIIPVAAPMMPPPPATYASSGTYWQDTSSPGCKGNQAPDWRDLSWTADVYANTTITFNACTADAEADLASCTPHTITTITGEGSCMADTDCVKGYCDANVGVCQIAHAGSCGSDAQCPSNAVCDTSVGECLFMGQPLYIGGALGPDNYRAYIRMGIELTGTAPFTAPPVVHNWSMTYLCNQVL